MKTVIEFETIVDRKHGTIVRNWSDDEVLVTVRVNEVAHDALDHAAKAIGRAVTDAGVVPSKRATCAALVLAEWLREATLDNRLVWHRDVARRGIRIAFG